MASPCTMGISSFMITPPPPGEGGGGSFFHDWTDDCNFIENNEKKNPSIGLQFLGSSLLSWNALAVEICI